MLKPKDRVRIRDEYLQHVSSYQFKALGYRPLVGEVVKVEKDKVEVDFVQKELPIYNGTAFGEKVRLNSRYGGGRSFPINMLEKVA